MTPRLLPVALAAILALGLIAPAQASTYALVVTNNRSLSPDRPDLHYADDDGAKWARLLGDLSPSGPEKVRLLTRFDAESTLLYPELTEVPPPTLGGLRSAVDALARDLEAQASKGEPSAVVLVLAGHGDIDGGQGYIELEDGRLTARMLDEEVIARLPADRIHLMLAAFEETPLPRRFPTLPND